MSRPIKPINPMLKGGYSERLTNRVPRKRIKPSKPITGGIAYDQIYKEKIFEFKNVFENRFGFNIFKTKGENLHVFLPLTGMSPPGHILKAFFEQTLPQARITFLITPKSSELRWGKDISYIHNAKKNLRNHILKSLNINDRYFVVFDFISSGATTKEIQKTLDTIYKQPVNYLAIDIVENDFDRTHIKPASGSGILLRDSFPEFKKKIKPYYNLGFELTRDKKTIEKLKR